MRMFSLLISNNKVIYDLLLSLWQYNEILSGYQPSQVVQRWKNQRSENHVCLHPQATQLLGRENFIIIE